MLHTSVAARRQPAGLQAPPAPQSAAPGLRPAFHVVFLQRHAACTTLNTLAAGSLRRAESRRQSTAPPARMSLRARTLLARAGCQAPQRRARGLPLPPRLGGRPCRGARVPSAQIPGIRSRYLQIPARYLPQLQEVGHVRPHYIRVLGAPPGRGRRAVLAAPVAVGAPLLARPVGRGARRHGQRAALGRGLRAGLRGRGGEGRVWAHARAGVAGNISWSRLCASAHAC